MNSYSEQRTVNLNKLEQIYNNTLDLYLTNYENYLKNKSKLLNDSPRLAKQNKLNILKTNQKLLNIINKLYTNVKKSDDKHRGTKLINSEKRNIINKNKKILEKRRVLLVEDKDDLLTKEARLNQLESMYRGKYKTYMGLFVTDIVIGVLLLIMLVYSF